MDRKEIEEQMYYILLKNIELERICREAEQAKQQIEKNKVNMIALAKLYIEGGEYND